MELRKLIKNIVSIKSDTIPMRYCNKCEHYYVTGSEKEGLIRANCRKFGMVAEIKPSKILFCPIGEDLKPIYSTKKNYECPVCGYPIGYYRDEQSEVITGKCSVCGYERKILK